jgi:hypothetical protein
MKKAVVIHSPNDWLVPFADSKELCRINPDVSLVPAGQNHRLNDEKARQALKDAVAGLLGQGEFVWGKSHDA